MKGKAVLIVILTLALTGCGQAADPDSSPAALVSGPSNADRLGSIPGDIVKGTPENDEHPPVLHCDEFETPAPLAVISTAGAEDSPFIPDDRDELYFFFANDVRLEAGEQVQNSVNGIWVSRRSGGRWGEPEAVILQDPGVLALNGAVFAGGDEMYFVSAREGYTGLHWFRAWYDGGRWCRWENADFDPAFEVGELHIHGDELYYHSAREGGLGGYDIWMLTMTDGAWRDPVNVAAVNTSGDEGMPCVSADGKELWFNRIYEGTPAVFRSVRTDEGWSEPQLIVSSFAGEPTLDREGNLYFVHHYYRDGEMIEADIYMAHKK